MRGGADGTALPPLIWISGLDLGCDGHASEESSLRAFVWVYGLVARGE